MSSIHGPKLHRQPIMIPDIIVIHISDLYWTHIHVFVGIKQHTKRERGGDMIFGLWFDYYDRLMFQINEWKVKIHINRWKRMQAPKQSHRKIGK